jgi:SAM-dependent methyltransferase
MSHSEYLLDGIDFSNIMAMDAGTGAGGITHLLARKMADAGGRGRIVSVDKDPEAFRVAETKLGEYAGSVEFVEADLTSMAMIEAECFDLVVCGGAMCALNDRPLKAVQGLSEFYRVLKEGGRLVVDEEFPLPRAARADEEVQVMRWQLYKATAELIGEGHYTEIHPEQLEFAASVVGFRDIEWRGFESGPLRKVTMEEWRREMPSLATKVGDEQTREALLALTTKVYKKFRKEGGRYPPTYVMKMRK